MRNFVNFIKYTTALVISRCVILTLYLTNSPYNAKQKIKRKINLGNGLIGKALGIYFNNDFKKNEELIRKECAFVKENILKKRIPDEVFTFSINKYGKPYRGANGGIENEQRGLILPSLYRCLDSKKKKNLLELGCCDGSVSTFLAKKYPQHKFTAVDLLIRPEVKKSRHPHNLVYVQSYALDLVGNYDILFASSTIMFMLPLELKAFFEHVVKNSLAKKIIISEPYWGDNNKTIKFIQLIWKILFGIIIIIDMLQS